MEHKLDEFVLIDGVLCCIQDLKGQDSGHYAPLIRNDPERGRVSLVFFLLDIKARVEMDNVLFMISEKNKHCMPVF